MALLLSLSERHTRRAAPCQTCRDLQAADHHNGHCQRHCGSLSEGTEPLIPIPVPIPDLPGIGGGGATPDLPGIGGPPPPQPPMILICVLGHCQCWHWALSDAD